MKAGRWFRGFGHALRAAYGPPYEREDDTARDPTTLEGAGELRQAARHLKRISERIAPGAPREVGIERDDQLQEALTRLTEGMRGP
jgi:hypothetical protein